MLGAHRDRGTKMTIFVLFFFPHLVIFWGKSFPPANKALNISGRISGAFSEKISETSFQISRFFRDFLQQKCGVKSVPAEFPSPIL